MGCLLYCNSSFMIIITRLLCLTDQWMSQYKIVIKLICSCIMIIFIFHVFSQEKNKSILQSGLGCILPLLNCHRKLLFECKYSCQVCFLFPAHFTYCAFTKSLWLTPVIFLFPWILKWLSIILFGIYWFTHEFVNIFSRYSLHPMVRILVIPIWSNY